MQCRDSVRCPDLWPSVCLDDPSGKQGQWERQGDRARHQDNNCDEVGSGCAVFTQVFQYSQTVSGADAQEAVDQARRVYMRELVHFGLGKQTSAQAGLHFFVGSSTQSSPPFRDEMQQELVDLSISCAETRHHCLEPRRSLSFSRACCVYLQYSWKRPRLHFSTARLSMACLQAGAFPG